MSLFDTHVCMVSAQAAPNLLPLLDEALKPEKVLLLVTPEMRQKGQWLADVIKPRGIKVETRELVTANNFDALQEILMEVIDAEPAQRIALNATGGTKWMAIAAQEVFRMNESPVFYVDVATDTVLFLGGKIPPHTLTQRIDIKNYLNTYGYQIVSHDVNGLPPDQRGLCEQMVLHVADWGRAIGFLNRLASEAEERKSLRVTIGAREEPPIYFDRLIQECRDAGVMGQGNMQAVQFTDERARNFCNGGWLEAYASRLLGELRGEGVLQDAPQLNMRVRLNSENEIDVAFMANNRLHIIECKTKRLAGEYAGSAGTDAVYKLDSISDLGGLGTKSMLVSYRNLKATDKQRAKDLRIKVVEGQQIQKLKSVLRDWINSR